MCIIAGHIDYNKSEQTLSPVIGNEIQTNCNFETNSGTHSMFLDDKCFIGDDKWIIGDDK